MQHTFICCIQQLSGSSSICYQVLLAMQRPETPVTEHEVADLVHCFPDDSVSQVCNVFAQFARQHDQEQQVRAWAEQLMADTRVETVYMNDSDSMLTYQQLVNYVNQDPDIKTLTRSRLHDEGTEPGSTVIYTMTARCQITNGQHTLERYQFPLVLAWCITIHKMQDLS